MLQQELGNVSEVVFRSDNEVIGAPIAFHREPNASLAMKSGKIKVVAASLPKDGHQVISFFHNLLVFYKSHTDIVRIVGFFNLEDEKHHASSQRHPKPFTELLALLEYFLWDRVT